MGNFTVRTDDTGKQLLTYKPETGRILEPYALTWLHSVRNQYFLRWSLLDSGYRQEISAEISGAVRLSEFLKQKRSAREWQALLKQCSKALLSLRESILDSEKLSLDNSEIWIFGRKNLSVRFTYLPFTETSEQTSLDLSEADFLLKLSRNYLAVVPKSKRKKLEDSLFRAAENGPEALLSFFDETPAEAKPEPQKKEKKERPDIPLPYLLIGGQALLLLMLYLLDRIQGDLPLSVFIVVVSFLSVLCIWQVILLMHPASAYNIRKAKTKVKPVAVPNTPEKVDVDFHPQGEQRTAILSLLAGTVDGKKERSWQILNADFLIGTDPDRCNLLLPEVSDEPELLLRICQRAGLFYAQSLSSTISIRLEGRTMYRYEDYQLADECQLQIANLLLRFRAF